MKEKVDKFQAQHDYRDRNKGVRCPTCGNLWSGPKIVCDNCRQKARDQYYSRKKLGCPRCGAIPESGNVLCKECQVVDKLVRLLDPNKHRTQGRHYYNEAKEKVFAHYGRLCACCGESEISFLTIDHINNDGAQHREQFGTRMYNWIVQNHFPDNLQTLCWNCNQGKRFNKGICPHQIKTQ